MRKIKKVWALLLAFAMVITSITVPVDSAKADDDVAVLKYVANEQEFRDYIDDDAKPTVDVIETEWSGVGDVHKIVVPEDGTILLAGVANEGNAEVILYANASLTAEIGKSMANNTIIGDFGIYKVEKGTYYYQVSRWNGYEVPYHVYTYAGFIPKSGKIVASGERSTTVCDASEVKVNIFSKESDLKAYILNDGEFASQDSIKQEWSGDSEVHKFTVDKDGWLLVANFEKEECVMWNLYSNVDLSAKYIEFQAVENVNADHAFHKIYLKAGTYYYKESRWNGYEESINTTFLGFVPVNDRISVANVKLTKDGAAAVVTFNYDKNYLPSETAGCIRVEKGAIQTRHIANAAIWHEDGRKNVAEANVAKITSNGTYTARIENRKDGCYGMVVFNVTGIKSQKPAMPKIKMAKRNTKTISGVSQSYMSVKITVAGKTYTVNANGGGNWKLKMTRSLKKGDVISAVCVNSAGKTSKVCNYKVK